MTQYHVASSSMPQVSKHAELRQRQRCLRDGALDYVLTHGTHIHRTGVTFVVLRSHDVPIADRRQDRWTRLVGTVVIVGTDGAVVTAYRNFNALRDIRRKTKYSRARSREFRARA
jgi:hypothetical protein